ncbi:MAG: hypothetical protein PsegKO_22890 [Pseudohongiellaceae bacterium]
MTNNLKILMKSTLSVVLGASLATGVQAQSGLQDNHPELAKLYNAFYVTQAEAYDAMASINADPDLAAEREELAVELEALQNMEHSMHGAMGMGPNMGMDHGEHDGMTMSAGGPFGEAEMQARMRLGRMVRDDYSGDDAQQALLSIESVPNHARRVLVWGRKFENDLWNIWADDSMSVAEKRGATEFAVQEYVTGDERHAVSLEPKNAALYLDHAYASGLKTAFPRISGLLWTNQWLQLASLEAIILGDVDPQFAGSVPTTLERFYNKLGSDTGMTMFPAPTEMPSAPAIAPQLYTQSQDAAVIIDNLNMLETAIGDIIAFPNLDDTSREEAILAAVQSFTSDEMDNSDVTNYLLSALRGGIYNQGGPAIGELSGSERNRSREAMDMKHTMIMSGPQ